MLLSLIDIYLDYGERVILDKISLNIDNNTKMALIGVNGMGKSSLLKTILNYKELDPSNYHASPNLKISYLEQDTSAFETDDILSYVCVDNIDEEIIYLAKSILTKLDIVDFSLKLNELSGGQKKRIALARCLVKPSDLIILDEPTNHLDIHMIEWLETYLKRINKAIVMVTHDRYFLENITDSIYELEDGNLYSYQGNFSTYLSLKQQRMLNQEATYRKQLSILKKEQAWMLQGAKARSTKSKDRIVRFENMQESLKQESKDDLSINLEGSRIGKKILEINDLEVGYNSKLIDSFSYTFKKGERLAIVGNNGSGKSTLLKTLARLIPPYNGLVEYGPTINIAYFAQGNDDLRDNTKVIDYIQEKGEFIETSTGLISASKLLEQFLFEGSKQHTLIGKLSGGEKRRLYLLGILITNPNFLILDEPTNDLDITTLSILEEYLLQFNGVIILVSHDRYFMERIAQQYAIIDDNKITFALDYHLEKNKNESTKSKDKTVYKKEKRIRLNYQEQQDLKSIDDVISNLQSQLSVVNKEMMIAVDDFQKINDLVKEQEALEALISEKEERWLYLHEKNDLANGN